MSDLIKFVARLLSLWDVGEPAMWPEYTARARVILNAMRDPGESGDWPRYTAGEWSRSNIEAFVDDMIGSDSLES